MKALGKMASATPSIRRFPKEPSRTHQQRTCNPGHDFRREHDPGSKGWMPEIDIALLRRRTPGPPGCELQIAGQLLRRPCPNHPRQPIAGLAITTVTLHVVSAGFVSAGSVDRLCTEFFNNDSSVVCPFLIEKACGVWRSLRDCLFLEIYACQGKRGERWRTRVESVLHPVPLLGTARKYLALSRLASALEALIGSGVSIIKSLGAGRRRPAARPGCNAESPAGKAAGQMAPDMPAEA